MQDCTYSYNLFACNLQNDSQITMNVTIITIMTSLLMFKIVEIIAGFETELDIIIHMIITPGESGQELCVVVFVILQQTVTDD